MQKKIVLVIVAVFVALLSSNRAEALILEPTADATIFDFGYINHTGYPQAASFSRAIIEYDISSISTDISSAIFNLNVETMSNELPLGLGFFAYNADGTITGEDYYLGDLFSEYTYNGEAAIQIDVTILLQNMVAADNNYAGFNIRLLSGDGWVAFNSLENPTAAALYINEPINAVPEPATLLLFSTGLIGFAAKRRRI